MTRDPLDVAFAALSDPTRRALLARLALGAASVGELAEPFDISLPAISRHLAILESADLIVREKDAQWRRCRLKPEGFRAASSWIEQYRRFWEDRFDALADYLENVRSRQEGDDDDTSKRAKRRGKRDRR